MYLKDFASIFFQPRFSYESPDIVKYVRKLATSENIEFSAYITCTCMRTTTLLPFRLPLPQSFIHKDRGAAEINVFANTYEPFYI